VELGVQTSALDFESVWIGSLSLGYRHALTRPAASRLYAGAMATGAWIPVSLQSAYGSVPASVHVYVQWAGMKMFHHGD
jgi:hypothetical protein